MMYMCHLFKGAVLDQEVQCLKMLGLMLRDHVVIVPDMVQVVVNMTLNPMAMALVFRPTALVDHVFPHVVPAFLKWHMTYLVFFSNIFPGQMSPYLYPS
jgi:hypothetical protein